MTASNVSADLLGQRDDASGTARWKNKSEDGSRRLHRPAFYMSMFGPPFERVLLAQAALRHAAVMPPLPGGEARAERVARGFLPASM